MAVSTPLVTQVDYLTLLTAQLKYQNPLDPLDNAQFLAQMAQFSNLQQMIDLNTKFDNFQGFFNQNLQTQSLMLLNRKVDFKDQKTAVSLSGFVDKIKFVNGVPSI
jgi:flagellar basal-body rod modification protein FlgD